MADDEWNDDGIDVAGSGPADDSETQDGTDTEEWRFSLDDLGEEAARTGDNLVDPDSEDADKLFLFARLAD